MEIEFHVQIWHYNYYNTVLNDLQKRCTTGN